MYGFEVATPLVGVSGVNVFTHPQPLHFTAITRCFLFLYTVVSSTKINRKPMNSIVNFAGTVYILVKIILKIIIEYLSMQWMPVKQ